MNYIFLGPPGSGKGTQAKRLAQKLKLFYFGTGDLMRQEAEKNTKYGQIFEAVWNRGQGELVDAEIVKDFVETKLKEVGLDHQFVFDGFPRTIKQAQLLDKIFTSKDNFLVFNIEVSPQSLIDRMSTRRVCSKCGKIFYQPDKLGTKQCDVCGSHLIRRQEDDPEVIKKRIDVYNDETKPLIDLYHRQGILVNINGEPPIEQVEAEIWGKINARNNTN